MTNLAVRMNQQTTIPPDLGRSFKMSCDLILFTVNKSVRHTVTGLLEIPYHFFFAKNAYCIP
jgi:hypothetical protein